MNGIQDNLTLPEENLTEAEFSRMVYQAGVSTGFDPVEGLYKVTYNERCWDQVYDPVWKGDCVTNSEKHIEYLVELWYRLNPDRSWTCIKGKRESLQGFLVSRTYCPEGRDYVEVGFSETRLLKEPKTFESFNFGEGDSTWSESE